jgi:hypothetical protein
MPASTWMPPKLNVGLAGPSPRVQERSPLGLTRPPGGPTVDHETTL